MATEGEKAALRQLGNEALLPLALADPLSAAVDVLRERGNTIVNGGLEKIRRTVIREADGTRRMSRVRVRNGKIVETDVV